jgi:5-methylcytosine-specific restriction endonuclease McrA
MFKSKTKVGVRKISGVRSIQRHTYNTSNGTSQRGEWWLVNKEVLARDNHQCVPCRVKGIVRVAKEVHHIVALTKGGTNSKSNLLSVCEECHNKRHNHLYRARGK